MDYARYYLGTLFMIAGIAGFALGGPWVWLGAATFPAAVLLDLLTGRPDPTPRAIRHPRLAEIPLYLHALLMPALVITAARCLRPGSMITPTLLGGIWATLAWLGVMPNVPVAHELIHRRGRAPRVLGFLLAVMIGDPLRRLAHLRGHHVKLGLPDDSDTARRGESIYAFMFRASIGGTREAFLSEKSRMARHGRSVWSLRSDVVHSIVATAGVLLAIGLLAGPLAALVIGGSFLLSRLLLEAFNYLQHYGIVRAPGTRYDRRHTWSHLTPVVRAAGLEITNHAHHHMNPDVPFHALIPDPTAPQMPSALLCFMAALVPPVWERWIAMPRLKDWDMRHASPAEKALAREANAAAGWPEWVAEEQGAAAP
ncbi:MAG: alkane 1-monooxygenase [Minicystis sp.]